MRRAARLHVGAFHLADLRQGLERADECRRGLRPGARGDADGGGGLAWRRGTTLIRATAALGALSRAPPDRLASRWRMARVRGASDARGGDGRRAVPADAPAGAGALRLARRPLRRRDHRAARRAATRLRAPPRAGAGPGAAEPASRLRPQARPPLRPDALAPPRPCRRVADPPAASVGGRRARRPELRRARRALADGGARGPARRRARRASAEPDARR